MTAFNFLVVSYHEGDKGLHRMAMVEREIVPRLGEDGFYNGRTKTRASRSFVLAFGI